MMIGTAREELGGDGGGRMCFLNSLVVFFTPSWTHVVETVVRWLRARPYHLRIIRCRRSGKRVGEGGGGGRRGAWRWVGGRSSH